MDRAGERLICTDTGTAQGWTGEDHRRNLIGLRMDRAGERLVCTDTGTAQGWTGEDHRRNLISLRMKELENISSVPMPGTVPDRTWCDPPT